VLRNLSPKMHAEIRALVEAAKRTGTVIQIYAEADHIRRANIVENIALEDVVEALIAGAAKGPGYVADPEEASEALLGNDDPHKWH
jgi:hypothetical protein